MEGGNTMICVMICMICVATVNQSWICKDLLYLMKNILYHARLPHTAINSYLIFHLAFKLLFNIPSQPKLSLILFNKSFP